MELIDHVPSMFTFFIFQLPHGLRRRVLPVQEPLHVRRGPELSERRNLQRGHVRRRQARSHLPVLVSHRVHGELLRDRRPNQRLQGQPVQERRDLLPTLADKLHVHMPAGMER